MGAAVVCGGLAQAVHADSATADAEPFKLVVEKNVKDSKGKIGIVPTFVSGGKRLCFNTRHGRPWFANPHTFMVYLPEFDKNTPALTISLGGYIPGVGGGKPFKGKDSVISVDEANQTVILTQDYFYAKDKTATFVCKVRNSEQGTFKIDWNSGLTPEQIQSLPKRSAFSVHFTASHDMCKELGATYGGQAIKLFTVEELTAGKKPKSWCNKIILPNEAAAPLKLYEKAPGATISVDFPSNFKTRLLETMWYDPGVKRPASINLSARAGGSIQVSGSLTLDLGTLAPQASSASPKQTSASVAVAVAAAAVSSASASSASEGQPVWELGKNPIDSKLTTGTVTLKAGVIDVDGQNTLSIPSSVLGDQSDYTIEFEVKRPAKMTSGHGILLFSNQDDAQKSGIQLNYYPPSYNACWLMVNTNRAEEKRGFLKDGFVKITLVVQDKQLMMFRDGLLLATSGNLVKPSTKSLTFGGANNSKRPPETYALRNIRIYDTAITPSGFDPTIARMRSFSGPGFKVDRVDIKDPSLPRILVIGDSISMGYRRYITEHYKGKAYVDYWVGGSWLHGANSILGKDPTLKKAWTSVLALGPYDAITWNPMGLHVWNPQHVKGRSPADKMPQMIQELVDHIMAVKADKTHLIWVTTTPFCAPGRKDKEVGKIDESKNQFIRRYNALCSGVVAKHGIPQVDLWAFGEKNLDMIGRDGVHWGGEASKMMAKLLIQEIDKCLP
jgi:hypothetical protein